MSTVYLDTSAAMKLIVLEDYRAELIDHLLEDKTIVASWLLYTELHCAAGRRPELISEELVRSVLDEVELVDLTRRDLIAAARLPRLRSQDAIHLVVAERLQVDEIVTYDVEMREAAKWIRLTAVSPGISSSA